jgi:hypothetical protein
VTPAQLLAQIKRYSGHDVWNLGLIEQNVESIVREGITGEVRWLSRPPLWTFLADPFVLEEGDGSRSLFAERMDYRAGKGSIWSARLRPEAGRDWAQFSPLLEAEAHMSFPFAFRDEVGQVTLLCETWEAGGASRFVRSEDGSWQFNGLVRPGERTQVDGVLHQDGKRWWFFCMHPARRPLENLFLYSAESAAGPWRPHPANPILRDRSAARPAGPLIQTSGGLIRPAQDCSTTYGGALVLNRVLELTPTAYREEVVRRIEPIAPYSSGLHAICPAGEQTIIDGKRWRFHPLDPFRKMLSGGRTKARRERLKAAWPRA